MGVSTKVFVNFKDFSQGNLHIVKDFIHVALTNDADFTYHPQHSALYRLYTVSFDLDCNDEANEILQGFSEYLKDKLSGCDVMIVYVPNDCESNSENVVVKDFHWETN